MTEETEYLICTSMDGKISIGCELGDDLNCKYDEDLVKCFRNRHIPFRILGFLVVGFASFYSGLYWAFPLFALVTLLNFTVIETYYLCKHCPFYEKKGETLECITLKGLPRLWKFDPSPISKRNRITMSAVGGFIDLFPLLVAAYASWVLLSTGSDILLTSMMIGLAILFLIATGYLEKFIGGNYCIKCVNLSCMMNKVPEELKEAYLDRNPTMRAAWEASGYKSGK